MYNKDNWLLKQINDKKSMIRLYENGLRKFPDNFDHAKVKQAIEILNFEVFQLQIKLDALH